MIGQWLLPVGLRDCVPDNWAKWEGTRGGLVQVQVQVGQAEGLRGVWPYETRFLSTSVFLTSFLDSLGVPHSFTRTIHKLFSQYTYTALKSRTSSTLNHGRGRGSDSIHRHTPWTLGKLLLGILCSVNMHWLGRGRLPISVRASLPSWNAF